VQLYRPILEAVGSAQTQPQDCPTAREILRALIRRGELGPRAERNSVSPRLTELREAGCVEALDRLKRVGDDAPAGTWRITERGRLLIDHLKREEQR
jgi:hypothetical protein